MTFPEEFNFVNESIRDKSFIFLTCLIELNQRLKLVFFDHTKIKPKDKFIDLEKEKLKDQSFSKFEKGSC